MLSAIIDGPLESGGEPVTVTPAVGVTKIWNVGPLGVRKFFTNQSCVGSEIVWLGVNEPMLNGKVAGYGLLIRC